MIAVLFVVPVANLAGNIPRAQRQITMRTCNLQNKIDSLRNQTIENGCTQREAQTAQILLRKLQARLQAQHDQTGYIPQTRYIPTEADKVLQDIRKQAREAAEYQAQHPTRWTKIKTWITTRACASETLASHEPA